MHIMGTSINPKFRHAGAGRYPVHSLKCFCVSALHCLFYCLDTGFRRYDEFIETSL
jgi:hypothetical protein